MLSSIGIIFFATSFLYAFVFNRDFAWSPSENIIAFWVPEYKDTPARVTLMEIPSRKEMRVKNLFNVSEVILF